MQLRNMNIGRQLKISVGIILLCVSFLGVSAWLQTDILWQQTKGLYDHPFKVSKAVGELKADILSIHRGMKDLVLLESDEERQTILQTMDIFEADAHRQFDILFDRYLGPRKDIDQAFTSFAQWKTIRAETIRLLREGKTDEAARRTKASGVGGSHAGTLLGHIQDVSIFANNRAEKFYQDATEQNHSLRIELALMVVFIILLSAGIGSFLYIRIRGPLKELTAVMEHFHQGELGVRCEYLSTNEFGILASSFNRMADAISLRIETEQKSGTLAEALISDTELRKFAETVLGKILEITESNMGAFYFRIGADDHFLPMAAIGVNPTLLEPFDASIFEGEFGKALKTGMASHIKDIRQDTVFTFKTFAGTAVPREIITVPLSVNGEIRGMLSLACLGGYREAALSVISRQSLIALNTAFANLLAGDQTTSCRPNRKNCKPRRRSCDNRRKRYGRKIQSLRNNDWLWKRPVA
jgi:HAMP domain-containing protein